MRTLVDRYGLAVDIVIDTGLNGLGWSYDQAYDLRVFHGRLLSLGSLPIALLHRELLASYAKP